MHWGVGGCIVDLGDGKHSLVSAASASATQLLLISSLCFVPAETGTLDHLQTSIFSCVGLIVQHGLCYL